MPNNETVTADTSGSIQQNGIPVITMELNASTVIPNAVDTTLKNAGEAADAKVVGDKIDEINATLGDALSDISDLTNQMDSVISEGGSLDTLDDKIDNAISGVNQTINTEVAKLIPKTDISTNLTVTGKVADAKAVGDAIGALNGSTLLYTSGTEQTIKDAVDDVTERVGDLESLTGEDIPLSAGVATSIKATVDTMVGDIQNLNARTANEIPYVTNGGTIKAKVDAIDASQPFAVHFDENLTIVRATFNDSRITADHAVTNLAVQHPEDIVWITSAGTLTVECSAGIPAMDLLLCIPATNS